MTRWQEVIHSDDRAAWLQALAPARAGQSSQIEYRVIWPDGGMRWLRESVRVTRKADGQSLQLDGVLTDFTERRQAEERLREERQLLRTLMENLPEAIYCKDAQGRYLVDNASHRRILGAESEEQVRGKTIRDFFPAEQAERYAADDESILRGGQLVQNHEEILPDSEGRPRYHAFTKVPLRDSNGQINGLVCIGRDVTAQREAQRQLARERNLLRTLMDNLPDHIFVKDLQSRFILANAATLRSLGKQRLAEVAGKTDFDFLPEERAGQFFDDEQRIIQSGAGIINHEELLIDAAGNARWLSTTKVPLYGDAGELIGLVGISHDVTERRHHGVGAAPGRRGGRDRQQGQERVPGPHEPRNPHADERHPRHDRADAGHRSDARAARVPADGADVRRIAADGDQRHPRFLQDRGGQAPARAGAVSAARQSRRCGSQSRSARRSRRGWNWRAMSLPPCPICSWATSAGCAR